MRIVQTRVSLFARGLVGFVGAGIQMDMEEEGNILCSQNRSILLIRALLVHHHELVVPRSSLSPSHNDASNPMDQLHGEAMVNPSDHPRLTAPFSGPHPSGVQNSLQCAPTSISMVPNMCRGDTSDPYLYILWTAESGRGQSNRSTITII